MDSIVAMKCTQANSSAYIFVMNMFNTNVDVGQNLSEESATVGDGDGALGYDMYFKYLPNGVIPEVWYQQEDDPMLVRIKLGAINSFQTYILEVDTNVTQVEKDPTGVHETFFLGASGDSDALIVNKDFNQASFSKFMDPNVNAKNINFKATGQANVHPSGYISTATTTQAVVMIDMSPAGQEPVKEFEPLRQSTDTTGFDSSMSSVGTITVKVLSNQVNVSYNESHFGSFSSQRTEDDLNADADQNHQDMASAAGNLFVAMQQNAAKTVDVQKMHQLAAQIIRMGKLEDAAKPMSSLATMLTKSPDMLFEVCADMLRVASSSSNHLVTRHAHAKLFYIFSRVGSDQAQRLLILHGLKNPHREVQMAALMSAGAMTSPNWDLVEAINELVYSASPEVASTAYFAVGNIMSNAGLDDHVVNRCFQLLMHNLKLSVSEYQRFPTGTAKADVVSALHALNSVHVDYLKVHGKAIQIALSPLFHVNHENEYLDETIRAVAARVLAKFTDIIGLMNMDKSIVELDVNPDFPFNKSYSYNHVSGGKHVSSDFSIELFIGTNGINCSHPNQWFNYEALAQAELTVSLWGHQETAFMAQAVYGADNGTHLADRIYLAVFNKVLYDKQLPQVDCSEHTYPIAHAAPGFHVSYTLWISIIPVTFTAGTTLTLDLSWGWQVCDTTLSAMVELIPQAQLTVSGDAEINLLIIKAGLQLAGSIGGSLRPQATISLTQCTAGVDLRQEDQGQSADFQAYYVTKKCKLWIFDCHWGEEDVKTLWSWNMPPVNKELYEKTWKIGI
eukprot:TRINITY_DN977_c0_g1_i1.p1 TRINITY_DN977_c0_g1~~TRINITY_DN977_c0_g1_i1.p1  ORF type:complete len:789 (+),score=287.66 TRINITY_DN977_c0_g1_i1:194-2560(+)